MSMKVLHGPYEGLVGDKVSEEHGIVCFRTKVFGVPIDFRLNKNMLTADAEVGNSILLPQCRGSNRFVQLCKDIEEDKTFQKDREGIRDKFRDRKIDYSTHEQLMVEAKIRALRQRCGGVLREIQPGTDCPLNSDEMIDFFRLSPEIQERLLRDVWRRS